MDMLSSVVSGFVVEVGKYVCKCIYPKIENTVHFSSNIENLRKEMEKLTKFRDNIDEILERAEDEGYKPKQDVLKWIKNDVPKLENEWETMQESVEAAKTLVYKCCPKCSLRLEVSTQAQNMRDQLCRLIEVGENFGSNLVVENYQMKKVEFIPGPSIEGQSTATKNLHKIIQLLEDDKVCIIGVLVPKPPTEIRKVQAQIANRLKLKVDNEESVESIASKIYQRLKQEKSFLLILDDVWEAINLDHIGVPQLADPARSKVILTSRFLGVCKQMKTDTEMNVSTLKEDESWQLFVKNAGDSANLEHIQPFAKEIARECDGLPLAITVIGASMNGKDRVELWEDALKSLRMSEPHSKDVKDKVYKVIKWSFDSLESQDIELSPEQRSKHVNKRRGDIQSCFLYCSLYPVSISTDDLINCWWAEGFLGENHTYEEAYNRGITMIESLKDACLLEAHEMDSVKMHDVVRDVAIWIDNSFWNEQNSLIQSGIWPTDVSHIKISASVKRISFVSSRIKRLPDCFTECPETTSLLLQKNPLEKIPQDFFFAFPSLRVLNLSETRIGTLPSSVSSLFQLHSLILHHCHWLRELPPIGDLHKLQLLDCANTWLCCLPRGMDKLTNLRLLNLPASEFEESIHHGFFLKLSNIEMLNMLQSKCINTRGPLLGPTCLDELSSLHKLTSLFIRLDRSSIFNRTDHTWMSRLKRFRIEMGEYPMPIQFDKSSRMICVSGCETFCHGELSDMLNFASELCLEKCTGLRKLIAYNYTFDGLKLLHIKKCSCDFTPVEEGRIGQSDPLPNLEHLNLLNVDNIKSVSDFGHFLGIRFSKLRRLNTSYCGSLTCLFQVGESFSVPKHLEEIVICNCDQLVELLVQCGSSQTTMVSSEIPRVVKLVLIDLPKLGTLGEPEAECMWEHLEELILVRCKEIRKLPFSIQTSNNIKVIRGTSVWWSQLEWVDDNLEANLEHCFLPI